MSDNRGDNANDNWLTPEDQITVLGPFDLDPCCPSTGMPWRTARVMNFWPGVQGEVPVFEPGPDDLRGCGLALDWKPFGRTWCNFPYSAPLAWVEKMAAHKNGILLGPGKSPDSRWGQLLLATADLVFFPKGRFTFMYPDGSPSHGKWNPHVYGAYGLDNTDALLRLSESMPGVLMARTVRTYNIRGSK